MSDLISRQAAIEAIEAEKIAHGQYLTSSYVGYEFAEDAIRKLPSAQPDIIRCKDCEFSHMTNDGKYCKYCDQFTDDYGWMMEMYFDADFFCRFAERREVTT